VRTPLQPGGAAGCGPREAGLGNPPSCAPSGGMPCYHSHTSARAGCVARVSRSGEALKALINEEFGDGIMSGEAAGAACGRVGQVVVPGQRSG
jgi:hypothetical protein